MTSHEMRNPLSVVMLSADSSMDAIKQIRALTSQVSSKQLQVNLEGIQDEIHTCLDALQTIISCSLHQKRVIDDVLTLSKLDSDLILITPVRAQPMVVVAEAVKMFEIECSKENIDLCCIEDASLSLLVADWVMMDPSRLHQVSYSLTEHKFPRSLAVDSHQSSDQRDQILPRS
jgi:signal transduction histidine kinase